MTCGGGTQSRTRTCTNPTPQYGGASYPGTDTTSQDCNTQICISEFIAKGFLYDFQFALYKKKAKTTLQPSFESLEKICQVICISLCVTHKKHVYIYDDLNYSVDGAWGAWGTWGDCTKSCASGRKSRSRICDNPKPANGGLDCPGSSGDFEYCNTHDCPTVPAGTYQQVLDVQIT